MDCNFLNWNCRGLRSQREDIEFLLNKRKPYTFCIQETMLHENKQQTFRRHTTYYQCTETGAGGVALIIRNDVIHSKITLNTNLQAVAARVTVSDKCYSVCSVYIPPSATLLIRTCLILSNSYLLPTF